MSSINKFQPARAVVRKATGQVARAAIVVTPGATTPPPSTQKLTGSGLDADTLRQLSDAAFAQRNAEVNEFAGDIMSHWFIASEGVVSPRIINNGGEWNETGLNLYDSPVIAGRGVFGRVFDSADLPVGDSTPGTVRGLSAFKYTGTPPDGGAVSDYYVWQWNWPISNEQYQFAMWGGRQYYRFNDGAGAWSTWHRFLDIWDLGTLDAGTVDGKHASDFVQVADLPTLNADTLDNKHASAFLSVAGSDLSASGYVKLGNNLVLQWGEVTTAGTSSVGFPVPFTTGVFSLTSGVHRTSDSWGNAPSFTNVSLTGFDAFAYTGSPHFYWLAIGV